MNKIKSVHSFESLRAAYLLKMKPVSIAEL